MELSDPIPTACLAGCIVLVFIHFFYLLDETIGSRPANATIGTAWMFNLAGIGFWMLGARNDEPVNQRVLFFLVLGFVFLSIVSFIEVRLVLKRRREIIEPLTVPVIPRPYVLPERRWKNGKPEYAAYVMGMLQQLVKVQPLPEGRRLQDPSFGVIGFVMDYAERVVQNDEYWRSLAPRISCADRGMIDKGDLRAQLLEIVNSAR